MAKYQNNRLQRSLSSEFRVLLFDHCKSEECTAIEAISGLYDPAVGFSNLFDDRELEAGAVLAHCLTDIEDRFSAYFQYSTAVVFNKEAEGTTSKPALLYDALCRLYLGNH